MPAEHITHSTTLAALLAGFADAPDIPVAGMAADSRRVSQGDAFLAVAGATHHGLDFAAAAIAQGAVAVIYDAATAPKPALETTIPVLGIENLAGRTGEIANRFFGRPSTAVRVFGVTGTNGKTTVAWMLTQVLTRLGSPCGYSGTLGYGVDELDVNDTMTSPDVVELNRRLAEFRDAGAVCAAVEVSSHALDQGRVDGIRFDSTVFTNLSRDHLDYHGDMQAYGEAKAKLFVDCPAARRIVSVDSDFGVALAGRLGDAAVTVSTRPRADVNDTPSVSARAASITAAGTRVEIRSVYGDCEFTLPVPGEFNVANAGLVIACLCANGITLDRAVGALSDIAAPPGRLQRVPGDTAAPAVFIDYAHTPDALEAALMALAGHASGKLWCVFGCGGERDAGKRPLMGRVAEQLADRVVVTNDNPRGEAAGAIVAGILAGAEAPADIVVIEDRAAAIAWSIAEARHGDVILVAGKGHEDYQLVGGERLDFSDFAVAGAALAARSQTEST